MFLVSSASRLMQSCLVICLVVCVGEAHAQDLTATIGSTSLWDLQTNLFMAAHQKLGFRWVTASRDQARAVNPSLTFVGLKVWEAIARFESGNLKEVTLSLYNRGDAGDLDEKAFQTLLTEIESSLTRWAGSNAIPFKEQDRTSTVTINRKAWVRPPHRLDLTSTFTPKHIKLGVSQPFRPEFVRLQITKFDAANAPRAGFEAPTAAKPTKAITILDLRARVKRELDGTVLLTGIPMVDQGQKGYCAAAVTERVLRYYGRDVDQHEIAQIANTTSGGGTSPDQMMAALRRVGDEMGVTVNIHQQFNMADFEKMIADYNRAAKSAGRREIRLDRTGVIVLADIFNQMDPKLYREARMKREAGFQSFKTTINKYVASGAPVVWSVMMGMVPETPPVRGSGGHLRLLTGINERTGTIYYTDTWGAGHEKKQMDIADAWAITLGLYTIEPKNVRF
jgi:hypothetical protein